MTPETLTALKGSIAKWEAIVDGTGVDLGWENCPLCTIFNNGRAPCRGCPVEIKTGQQNCWGSPYTTYTIARRRNEQKSGLSSPELLKAAQAELDFLRSLLPTTTEL